MSDGPSGADHRKPLLERLAALLLRVPEDREQLLDLLRQAHERELLDAEAMSMIEGVLQISELTARDVMVPRAEMDVIDISQPPAALLSKVVATGHSRFPVVEGDRDNVVGIVHAKSLLRLFTTEPVDVHALLRPALFVPESQRLVVDEYGGTAGLVTLEDVIEQIVGDIDEALDSDAEEADIVRVESAPGAAVRHRVRAGARIDAFNEAMGTSLPSAPFETIGALVGDCLGHPPRRGERVEIDGVRFEVLRADATQALLLRTEKLRAAVGGAAAPGATTPAQEAQRAPSVPLLVDPPPQVDSADGVATFDPRFAQRPAAGPRRASHAGSAAAHGGRERAQIRLATLGFVFLYAPILSLVAGLAQAASFWPVQAWWLQVLALAALVALVLRLPQRAFVLGFAFGLGCFVAGVSWLYVSMHRYGGMPAALAALALLLFAAYLASFGAAVCAAFARVDTALRARAVAPTLRATALGALFAGAWALAELLRGWLFTGFPWLAIGYAQLDGPLASFAPLLGVYGVGLLVAAGLGLAAIDRVSPHGAPLHVRLLQGNVAQDMKFDAQRSLDAMHWYANELRRGDAPLTVLPETAWTLPWSRTPLDVREEIVDRLRHTGAAVAIGMPLYEDRPAANASAFDVGRSLTNSVGVVDATGAIVWRYDKRHLVPFGEFVPFGFGWFVDLMRIPLGDFARGSRDQAPLPLAGQRIAFDICYEDLFGEEIAAQVRGGATILVNVSNIAWFGDSHALPQHLQIARMRALELARPMLRATNTGVTAAIDAHGRVLAQLEPYTAGALDVQVQGADGTTPYARFGNAPVFALSLGLVAAAAVAAAVASARFGTRTTGRRDDSSR